jgi:hypothetical protein
MIPPRSLPATHAPPRNTQGLAGGWTAAVEGELDPDHPPEPLNCNDRITSQTSLVFVTLSAGTGREMVSVPSSTALNAA